MKKTICIFCGTPDIGKSIDEWKRIISNKALDLKKQLLDRIQKVSEELNKYFISRKDIYENLIPMILNTATNLLQKLNVIKTECRTK